MDLKSLIEAARPYSAKVVSRAGSLLGPMSTLARVPMADVVNNSPGMRVGMQHKLLEGEALPNVDYSKFGMQSPMDLLKAAMKGEQPKQLPYASPFDEAGMTFPTEAAPAPVATPAAVPMPRPRPAEAPASIPMTTADFQDQWNQGGSPYAFGAFDAPGAKPNVLQNFLKLFG